MPSSSTTRIITDVVGVGTRSPEAPLHNVGATILDGGLQGPYSLWVRRIEVETCRLVIPTGAKPAEPLGYSGDIIAWWLTADTSATVSVDVWVCDWFQMPISNTYSITGGNKMTLTATTHNRGFLRDIPTWKRRIKSTDMFAVSVDANDNAASLTVALMIRRLT